LATQRRLSTTGKWVKKNRTTPGKKKGSAAQTSEGARVRQKKKLSVQKKRQGTLTRVKPDS